MAWDKFFKITIFQSTNYMQCMAALREVLKYPMEAYTNKVIGFLDFASRVVSMTPEGITELQKQRPYPETDEAFRNAYALIKKSEDHVLQTRVDTMNTIVDSFAKYLDAMHWWLSASNDEGKTISDRGVSVLTPLRQSEHWLDVSSCNSKIFDDRGSLFELCNMNFPYDHYMTDILRNIKEFLASVYELWRSHISTLKSYIEGDIPDWQAPGAKCLDDPLRTLLIENKKYAELSGCANKMETYINLIHKLHIDKCGTIVDPSMLKDCDTTKAFAVQTVTVTYAVYQCFKGIPDQPEENRAAAAKIISDQIAAKQVALPEDVAKCLAQFAYD
jgi:hypothetical protein